MSTEQKPAIAITMGDPCGIGPEVVNAGLKVLDHICDCEGIALTIDEDLRQRAAHCIDRMFELAP